jgi:hypothetical protein
MYAQQKPGTKYGFLRSTAIQYVANRVLFNTTKKVKGGCLAVVYKDLFKPLSKVTLALILNGVCFSSDILFTF